METYRQQKEKMNRLLESIPNLDEKDRTIVYSWSSLKEYKIQLYSKSKDKAYSVKWCEKCKNFECYFGKRCCICKAKESGLGNPEVHAKTIKTQIENGTFNMLNTEVQKNKISNENIKYTHKIKFCNKCNANTQHRIWLNGSSSCCKCDFKDNGMKEKFCVKCAITTTHNGSICTECNPDAISASSLLFKSVNISKCIKHNDCKLQYYNKIISQYICWECYKEEFVTNFNIDFLGSIKLMYPNAFIQNTFRSQESDNWNGLKEAFEQNLVEKIIAWMSYVKFYINENNVDLPLVVGKTGSRLVNRSGTDVIFSTNANDGPARLFLFENNLKWNKTQILIIPCITEEQALNIEQEMVKKYKLFES